MRTTISTQNPFIAFKRRKLLIAAALAAWTGSSQAQMGAAISRIIVPFAAGGAREMPARVIQQGLGKELGQNWIIENKPGAGGAIGTSFVAQAVPNGQTLLMAGSSHFVTAAIGAKPFYDPIKDFSPVANIGKQSYLLMVNANLPVKNASELIAYAKRNPGVLNYNSAGVASSTHLAMAYFSHLSNVSMQHIPFKGTGDAANDVTGGRGHVVIVPTAGVGVFLQDARLRILGITAQKRSHLFPNVPTISESGLPNFFFESWFGLLAPKATPLEVIAKINTAVNKVIALKEVNGRLENLGIETAYLNVDGFNKLFLADRDLMTKIVKDSGLKLE